MRHVTFWASLKAQTTDSDERASHITAFNASKTVVMENATINPTIDASYGIENIQRPILLMHNVDDNNVNIAVTLSWFAKAREILRPLHRDSLLRMLITPRSNPLALDAVYPDNKGHYFPVDNEPFLRMADHMIRFMTEGASALRPSNFFDYLQISLPTVMAHHLIHDKSSSSLRFTCLHETLTH